MMTDMSIRTDMTELNNLLPSLVPTLEALPPEIASAAMHELSELLQSKNAFSIAIDMSTMTLKASLSDDINAFMRKYQTLQ